jgi:hypothetical protein
MSQAQSGLSGPGRGVGIPNLMNMMPTMGRGVTPINPPRMQMPQQNIQSMPNIIPMGMQQNIGGMIRPPMINPMMIRPPQGGVPGN